MLNGGKVPLAPEVPTGKQDCETLRWIYGVTFSQQLLSWIFSMAPKAPPKHFWKVPRDSHWFQGGSLASCLYSRILFLCPYTALFAQALKVFTNKQWGRGVKWLNKAPMLEHRRKMKDPAFHVVRPCSLIHSTTWTPNPSTTGYMAHTSPQKRKNKKKGKENLDYRVRYCLFLLQTCHGAVALSTYLSSYGHPSFDASDRNILRPER